MSEHHPPTPKEKPITQDDLAPRPEDDRRKVLLFLGIAVLILFGLLVSAYMRHGNQDGRHIVQATTQPAIQPELLAREAEREIAREAQRRILESKRRKRLEQQRLLAEQKRLEALMSKQGRSLPRATATVSSSRFSSLSPLGFGGQENNRTAGRRDESMSSTSTQHDEALDRASLYRALSGESAQPIDSDEVSAPSPEYRPIRAEAHRPIGVYLRAGTAIPATLLTRIVTERPGPVQAVVTYDVYETGDDRRVLIPAGTRILGFAGGQPAAGERSIDIAWQRLIFADGTTRMLSAVATSGGDGAAGLRGHVDNHWPSFYGHAFLTSITGAIAQLSQPGGSSTRDVGSAEDAASALGRNLAEVTREVARRNLQRQPTIDVASGTRLAITLLEDLVFSLPTAERGGPS